MPDLAYVNGNIMPVEQAVVPIEDRGYQFGDAVYEFMVSYRARLFCLEEHLDRLERSMGELFFPKVPREKIREAILTLFERGGFQRAGIYLQISRGAAPRNHPFPEHPQMQFVMTIRKGKELPADLREKGASVITVKDLRWGRCDIKTVQLLPNVLAKQQAMEAGVYDAVFVAETGEVREASSSNLFIVKDGALLTHPLSPRILGGITRAVVIDLCRDLNLPVKEDLFGTDALYDADEAFLTGTITEVLPVTAVDGKAVGAGKPGPVTRRLYEALYRRMNEA